MPTVTVYSLGGTWTSAPTFTYTSGVTLEERLNYTDNNGAHDNILDDMFGLGNEIKIVAECENVLFADLNSHVCVSNIDGVHYDSVAMEPIATLMFESVRKLSF
ncbi:hypothetical protein N9F00_05275 [Planktomarina temperata]|nr:hypothetical protein [Planktomarina temperata]